MRATTVLDEEFLCLLISNQSWLCKGFFEVQQRPSLRLLSPRSRPVRAMSDTQPSGRRCASMRGPNPVARPSPILRLRMRILV